jgi:Icc-related predicted phosphoesterase
MPLCFFVCDLHGRRERYLSLFRAIETERPAALFMGGDLLPHLHGISREGRGEVENFLTGFIAGNLVRLKDTLGESYPRIFVICGNDDARIEEEAFEEVSSLGLWEYVPGKKSSFGEYPVYGYSYVSPTPFLLKDWEKYDVSRFVDPGCISPEEGIRTVDIPEDEKKYGTIADDLEKLAGRDDLGNALLLFHSPPYRTSLDRAGLDGKKFDNVPLDVHVGSIAVRNFIEERQPLLTMHGHVHEAARITGSFKDKLGRTHCLSAAHDGPQLALVRFDPAHPEKAERELISL